MEKFSFPILGTRDIFTHLKHSLQISNITQQDILKPKQTVMKWIYTQLLQICQHRPKQEFLSLNPAQIEKLKHVKIYSTGIQTVTLFKLVYHLLNRIGCKNDPFKLADLINPDFKRTRKFLSAFINYIRFMTEQEELIYDSNSECVVSRVATEQHLRTREEFEKLNQQVQQLSRKKQEQQPILQQKQKIISELEQEKQVLEQEKFGLQQEISYLQKQIQEREQVKIQSIQNLQLVEQQIQSAQSEILIEPQKEFQNLEKLKLKRDQENHQLSQLKKEMRVVNQKVDLSNNIQSKIQQANLLLENCEISNSNLTTLRRTVNEHKQKSLEIDKEIRQKEIQIQNRQNQRQNIQQRKARQKKQIEDKEIALEENLNQKQLERIQAEVQMRALETDVEVAFQTLEETKSDLRFQTENYQNQLQTVVVEHEKLVRKAQNYKEQVEELLARSSVFNENKENFG